MAREDSREFIGKVFEDGFPTINIDDLSPEEKRAYCTQAVELLASPVFKNEINFIINNTIKEITCRAKTFEEVLDLRMSINGLKALKERFEELAASTFKPKQKDPIDPYSAI